MKKFAVILVGLLALSLVPACKYSTREQPGGAVGGISLAPAIFDVAGETVGEACVSYVLGVAWGRLFSAEAGHSGFNGGFGAEGQAMYDALGKIEGATFLVNGQVKTESSGFLPFYWRVCSTVRGRAVTIKSTNTN